MNSHRPDLNTWAQGLLAEKEGLYYGQFGPRLINVAEYGERIRRIVDGLCFVVGPMRGGTTLCARYLHQFDDMFLVSNVAGPAEHTVLFDGLTQQGICASLGGASCREWIVPRLVSALFSGDCLVGVEDGSATADLPIYHIFAPIHGELGVKPIAVNKYRMCPLSRLSGETTVILKHPELCFGAHILAGMLPQSTFVFTCRGFSNIVASMRRLRYGRICADWIGAHGAQGIPVNIPASRRDRWIGATPLQVNALLSYEFITGLIVSFSRIAADRRLFISMEALIRDPASTRAGLGSFLKKNGGPAVTAFEAQFDPARNTPAQFTGEQKTQIESLLGDSIDSIDGRVEQWCAQMARGEIREDAVGDDPLAA